MLNSEVVKYTNVVFGTDESVLFIEVSLTQECPYRERFHCTIYRTQDGRHTVEVHMYNRTDSLHIRPKQHAFLTFL